MALGLSVFLRGIATGFSISVPVGPIGYICIHQALSGGFLTGLFAGLGAATADVIYGVALAMGVQYLIDFFKNHQLLLVSVGGIFLCVMGFKIFYSPIKMSYENVLEKGASIFNAFITTFFLTLTNPITMLIFTGLMSVFSLTTCDKNLSIIFVVGIFIGSMLWWAILASLVSMFRYRISFRFLNVLNKIAGIIIGLFGILAILNSLLFLR